MAAIEQLYYIKDSKNQYLREFTINAGRINKTFVNSRSEARAFNTLTVAQTFNNYPELNETIIQVEIDIDTVNLENTTGTSHYIILDDKGFYLQVFGATDGIYTKCFNEDFTVRRRFSTLVEAEAVNNDPKLLGVIAKVTETEVIQA